MVENLLMQFITQDTIEKMGAWYPRVLAVMSCVIPTAYLLCVCGFFGLVLYTVYKILK